jgi:cyclic pyranopterin phosphate synthase
VSGDGERLSHVDEQGTLRMVDVGEKPITTRVCVARGEVRMARSTLERIAEGTAPKGDVLTTARLAGIQAAKRTHEWIPLAHPLALDVVDLTLQPEIGADGEARVVIEARVRAQARTGVEMEAMVATAAAGLTIYDMCKAVDRGMRIEGVRLIRKSGGKSGTWESGEA